jgi:hypothetical protein
MPLIGTSLPKCSGASCRTLAPRLQYPGPRLGGPDGKPGSMKARPPLGPVQRPLQSALLQLPRGMWPGRVRGDGLHPRQCPRLARGDIGAPATSSGFDPQRHWRPQRDVESESKIIRASRRRSGHRQVQRHSPNRQSAHSFYKTHHDRLVYRPLVSPRGAFCT